MVKGIEKGKSKSIEGRFSFEMESSRERGTHSRTWSLSEPETAARSGSPITRSSKRRSYHERIPTQPPSPKQRGKKEVEAHAKRENVDKPKQKEKHPTKAADIHSKSH